MMRVLSKRIVGVLVGALLVGAGCTGSYGQLGTTSFLIVNIVPDASGDDNEDLGTYAAGASSTVWFTTPRVADVRGVAQGGAATSFPHQQVSMDTGYHPHPDNPTNFDFSVIVTRIAADGFYVTDINDPR